MATAGVPWKSSLDLQMQPISEVKPTILIAGRESMNWTGEINKT
jgi:hypothetical protein